MSEGRVSECTHTPRKKKSHTSACVYISAACTCQHTNIRSPAPHLYTHQRHVRTSTKTTKHRHQHKKIRSSAPHSHTRTNMQKKNVHTNISKMHTPGGLRTIHIHMHMLRTVRIHIHIHMLSTIHRAKKNHA